MKLCNLFFLLKTTKYTKASFHEHLVELKYIKVNAQQHSLQVFGFLKCD